jgi:hypothetical protein
MHLSSILSPIMPPRYTCRTQAPGLAGNKLMRFIFVDESGTGNPKFEPFIVVAAIIVHADKQLTKLEEYLGAMAAEFVPVETRHLFKGFHAVELYSGGAVFKRDKDKLTAGGTS